MATQTELYANAIGSDVVPLGITGSRETFQADLGLLRMKAPQIYEYARNMLAVEAEIVVFLDYISVKTLQGQNTVHSVTTH